MKIAEQISRLRTQSGMSQGELADKLEVSRQSVSKWETGASVPEIDKLLKMSILFGVSLDELVTGEAPEPKPTMEKSVTLGQILGAALLILAGLCIAVTVLFAHSFGIHTSEGVLLAVWFALLGLIVLMPRNDNLRISVTAVYAVSALVLLLLTLLRLYALRGTGIFLLIGMTLIGWAGFARQK